MKDFEFRDLIERVRERTDIVQVVAQHIDLDQHNRALCPFHNEKTPSFHVNTEKQFFHCFGCGVGGDVFKFLELFENKPFTEVLFELAREAGVPISSLTPEDKHRISEGRSIGDILSETASFYHRSLTSEVKDYLTRERGFSEETITHFRIGYSKGGLREHLIEKRQLPLNLCVKAGVLRKKDDGVVRDYFINRIIFPNLKRGRVVHLSGRSFNGKEPKYLHLPGEIRNLHNEDALYSKEVCITEGIPDCLSAVQADYPAVATLGTSGFKQEYLPRLARCEKIYLCFDGDSAGKKAALKVGRLIGERARVVQLPEGLDLNDYLKAHSKEDFRSLLDSAQDIIKYQLSLIPPETDKTQLPDKLRPILEMLARMEKAQAEAYLSYQIKPRFKLKKEDIDGYRELIRKHRKPEVEAKDARSPESETESKYGALFDGLIDLVEHEGNSAFLIKEEEKLNIVTSAERGGITYVPPPIGQIPWPLPRGNEVRTYYELQQPISQKDADGALYDDLLAYHKAISELPGEEYYGLLVAWDLHTYLLESVQYSPVICLFAVPERGKSRTGKGMIHVAYRGIHVESLRDAYLVRVAHDLRASLFFDVKDIWKKAEKNGSEDIVLHRFEKGAKVPRVLYPDRGAHQDIVYYSTFGPTVIGTNEGVHRILETRSISVNMPETTRRFENDVTPESALPLKERLVAFRARHLGEPLLDIPKPADGRLGDILKPLLQIVRLVKPEREEAFRKLVSELESERMIEKADSLEAQILVVTMGLEGKVERGMLPVKTITDTLNEDRPEKSKASYQRVGRRLNAMGFKKARVGNNVAILWDDEKVKRMAQTYGLRQTHETHEKGETHDSDG